VGQLDAQSRLHPSFHCSKDIDSAYVVNNQAIFDHLGKLVFPGQGNAVLIQYGQDGIGCPEVNADPKRPLHSERFAGLVPV
jgi:hypothetical protein